MSENIQTVLEVQNWHEEYELLAFLIDGLGFVIKCGNITTQTLSNPNTCGHRLLHDATANRVAGDTANRPSNSLCQAVDKAGNRKPKYLGGESKEGVCAICAIRPR